MNDWQGIFPQGPLPYQQQGLLPPVPDWLRGASYTPLRLTGTATDLGLLFSNALGLTDPNRQYMGSSDWMIDKAANAGLLGKRTGSLSEMAGDILGQVAVPGVGPTEATAYANALPYMLGIFKGMNANLSDTERDMLAKAFEMEQSGAGREAIRQATNPPGGSGGWFRNPADRQWRMEVDDSRMGIHVPENLEEAGMLPEFVSHPQAMESYPQFKNLALQFSDDGGGFYQSGIITTSPQTNARSITLHEMQHPVQDWEGFARGASPEDYKAGVWQMSDADLKAMKDEAFTKKRVLGYFEEAEKKGITPQEALQQESKLWGFDTGTPRIRELLDAFQSKDEVFKYWKSEKDAIDKYTEEAIFEPIRKYKKTAGEAEARLVQARRDLTPAQRLAIDPIEQMDTMLKSEGILGGIDDLIVRYGDGPAMSAKAPVERYTGEVAYRAEPDDFVYHVTTAPKAKRIMEEGFNPKASKTVKGGFYENYSKDKVFFTDKDGLGFWRDRIEEHLDQAMDNPPDLVVLRARKSDMPGLQIDDVGTKDAHANSYFLPNEAQKQQGLLADTPAIPDELPFGYPERIEAFRKAREHAALPVEQGGLGLGPANTAAERAAAGGAIDAIHGTASDVDAIKKEMFGSATGAKSAKQAFWAVSDPGTARGYAEYAAGDAEVKKLIEHAGTYERLAQKTGSQKYWDKYDDLIRQAEELDAAIRNDPLRGQNLMPLKIMPQQPSIMDAAGAEFVDVEGGVNSFLRDAKKAGSDVAIINNLADDVGFNARPATHYAVFNPAAIRSRFAAFDPFRRNESDLLASWLLPAAGMGLLGLGYLGQGEQTY